MDEITRRPLLVAASADHAQACASRLSLPPDAWDYIADNSTFRLHRDDVQIVLCSGIPSDGQLRLLGMLGLNVQDALVMSADGLLSAVNIQAWPPHREHRG